MSLEHDIAIQLQRLQSTGFDAKLKAQADAKGLTPSLLYAIASRETNCVNEQGDFQNGEAHGVGIIQIDIQHDIARLARDSGSWRTDPDPLISFGAGLLATNIAAVAVAFADLDHDGQLKIAASGYNCGIQNAIASARSGDRDARTTGRNYGQDVMARKAIFDELIVGRS
jgi:hypothetical protein